MARESGVWPGVWRIWRPVFIEGDLDEALRWFWSAWWCFWG